MIMQVPHFAALKGPMGRTAASLNLIWVLTWLKFLPRSRRESAKLFWLFVEPAGQLAILIILFTFIGRTPAYGTSMALFLLTGIVMLNFFQVGSGMVMQAMLGSSNKLRLAPIGVFHDAIASSAFKLITAIGYTSLLLIGVWYVQGIDVVPQHPLIAVQAFLWCTLSCLGWGMLRAYAIGQGASTQTALLILAIAVSGVEPLGLVRDLIMVAAWVINLMAAELLIRRTFATRTFPVAVSRRS